MSPEVGLWKDVLESKYGSWRRVNLITPDHNKYKYRWWTDLCKVCNTDQGTNLFDSNVVWEVGYGS